MVAVYPVSSSISYVRPSTKIDASDTGEKLVCVPVCTRFHFCEFLQSDLFYDLNRIFDSTYILGKL